MSLRITCWHSTVLSMLDYRLLTFCLQAQNILMRLTMDLFYCLHQRVIFKQLQKYCFIFILNCLLKYYFFFLLTFHKNTISFLFLGAKSCLPQFAICWFLSLCDFLQQFTQWKGNKKFAKFNFLCKHFWYENSHISPFMHFCLWPQLEDISEVAEISLMN